MFARPRETAVLPQVSPKEARRKAHAHRAGGGGERLETPCVTEYREGSSSISTVRLNPRTAVVMRKWGGMFGSVFRMVGVWPARHVVLVLGLAAVSAAVLGAAELKEETLAAWNRYIAATEQRIARELEDGERFLVLDFLLDAEQMHSELLAGRPVLDRMETRDEQGERIEVPKGRIHHWRGAILVPNADLDEVVDGLQYSIPPEELQSDVIESRVLWREGNRLRSFLKLNRKTVVTMHYNTEHEVEYFRPGGGRAWSRSVSTRVVELDKFGTAEEREKPVGNDSGYLWRLNAYWRYQQVAGGVLMECEIVTLSRSVPFLLRWMVSPIINRESRSALLDMLQAMQTKLDPGVAADWR